MRTNEMTDDEIAEFERTHVDMRPFYKGHIEAICGNIARCRSKAFRMFSSTRPQMVEEVAAAEFWDMVEAVNRFQRAERDLVVSVTDANAHGVRIVVLGGRGGHPEIVLERDEDGNNIDAIYMELSINNERAADSARWDKWRPEGSE